jgi:thioredoxin 1
MTSPAIATSSEGGFSLEALQSPAPVLVYFWAEWCSPCKTVTPMLDELADLYRERVKICKINIDEHPALAAEYGIRAIPTLMILRKGQIADQIIGFRCKRDLEDSFNQARA